MLKISTKAETQHKVHGGEQEHFCFITSLEQQVTNGAGCSFFIFIFFCFFIKISLIRTVPVFHFA